MESFLWHQMLSLFFTLNFAYVLEINIFGRDYSNLRHLKKKRVMGLQVRAFKNYNKLAPAYNILLKIKLYIF